VAVRLPPDLLELIDRHARAHGLSRAATIRLLVADGLRSGPGDGVDRAQIRRMLALTPVERIRQLTASVEAQSRLRGIARRPKR
jgi:hypothetical protein